MINKIFASFHNYSIDIYHRFLGSLLDTGYSRDIYFLSTDQDCLDLYRKLYNHFKTEQLHLIHTPIDLDVDIPQIHRFIALDEILTSPGSDTAGHSLFCDSRDVLFQSNPEDIDLSDNVDLYAFEEGNRIIDSPKWNGKWADYMHGIYHDVDYKDKKAICVGVLIFSNTYIKSFFSQFTYEIKKNNLEKVVMDQGLFNYLFYKNKLDCNSVLIPNINDSVYHIGLGADTVAIQNNKLILQNSRKTPAIMHQYDRLPSHLLNKISTKYNFNI